MSEAVEKFFDQSKSFATPVVKASKLAVANLEKLVAFQFSALQSYSDLALSRLKAATEVTDLESFQSFASAQLEAATALRQKLMDDAKALVDLSAVFKAEFDKLAEETAAELPKTVQAFAPRKAA